MGRRARSVKETFKTIGELMVFLTRRGQWWLLPLLIIALVAGGALAVAPHGVFAWIYTIF
ncbi:hypothetical protein JXA47_12020 [Candidatus Sumerlaeota bacterium]|nr:hypothetical protein [Candidatus Sumerlaeota bacterium]